ncbi:hypothetical protein UFOVP326_16 [uncultured Caudovirales phage]|uniref:Uncharacterized protein n=1 Tax=uncultured Caudovirales phage TaxID=2100421 RepID=A0A6J5LWD6_9CAUD|nr:hypothetical protein UFOVP326_16 [uncultured Caudovirales phage]
MKLSPRLLNAHLRHMGQDVSWQRAAACPCRDPHTGAARQGCPHCDGKGWFWGPGRRTRVALTGMRVAKEWERFGLYESGDVVVSIGSDSAAYAAGEKDRMLFLQSSEPVQHQGVHTGTEKLPFLPLDIERVFAVTDPAESGVLGMGALGGLVLGGELGAEILECAIRSVAPDGTITWTTPPPVGSLYTLIARRPVEYFLFKDLPQDRAHHGGLALPRRVALRRFDLFDR